jgi:hypothetical protein
MLFDRRMIDPTVEELRDALTQAAHSRGLPREPIDPGFWDPLLGEVEAQPEGGRYGIDTARVILAWWSDHLGRRHVRVSRATDVSIDPEAPQPVPTGWAPLGQIYPEHILIRQRPGGDEALLAVCRCGEWGRPGELAWMGETCGACHDRAEEAGEPCPVAAPFVLEGQPRENVMALAFTPDGQALASVNRNGIAKLWDLTTGLGRTVMELGITLHTALEAPGGRLLLLSEQGQVWELDSTTGRHALLADGPVRPFHLVCAARTPEGRVLLVGAQERHYLLDLADGALELLVTLFGARVGRALFSPEGVFWWLDLGRTLRSMDLQGRTTVLLEGNPQTPSWTGQVGEGELAASADGRWLVRAWSQRGIHLWDVAGRRARELSCDPPPSIRGMLRALAFSPDGLTLASSTMLGKGPGGGVKLWSVPDGLDLGTLSWEPSPAWALAFSPDGQTLAAASFHGSIRLLRWRSLLGLL